MLIEAARANRNFEQDGQGWYSQISALSDQGKKTKAFTEEQTKQIDKELQDWLTEKVAFDKEQADAAEESRKASEELDKEVKAAEQEKAAAEAKKKTEGNKPASTGGQPTTTGN